MSVFACPVCGGPLTETEKTYLCKKGHSYDIAAQGYVHLMRPNEMHSHTPGDAKESIAARRRFLESGWYDAFSNELNRLVLQYTDRKDPVLLDAGCGEGFYTGRMVRYLQKKWFYPEAYGFDISKYAVREAAKRYPEISFAVGSMFHIPVLEESCGCVTDVFAPIVPEELFRVLRPGGVLILAVPGERHLYGLKEILYEKPYENERKDTEYPGFQFLERTSIKDAIEIHGNNNISDLFAMTPYYWKTPREGCERLRQTETLKTEISFDFLIYRKEAAE